MIWTEELSASLDQSGGVVVFHRIELSRTQQLAQVVADKVGIMVDQSEKALDIKMGGTGGWGERGDGAKGDKRGEQTQERRGRGERTRGARGWFPTKHSFSPSSVLIRVLSQEGPVAGAVLGSHKALATKCPVKFPRGQDDDSQTHRHYCTHIHPDSDPRIYKGFKILISIITRFRHCHLFRCCFHCHCFHSHFRRSWGRPSSPKHRVFHF